MNHLFISKTVDVFVTQFWSVFEKPYFYYHLQNMEAIENNFSQQSQQEASMEFLHINYHNYSLTPVSFLEF